MNASELSFTSQPQGSAGRIARSLSVVWSPPVPHLRVTVKWQMGWLFFLQNWPVFLSQYSASGSHQRKHISFALITVPVAVLIYSQRVRLIRSYEPESISVKLHWAWSKPSHQHDHQCPIISIGQTDLVSVRCYRYR